MSSYDASAGEAENAKKYTPTIKAYRNPEFLNSPQGRLVRIICEYEETMMRLKMHDITATVLIFGSARSKTHEEYAAAERDLQEGLTTARSSNDAKLLHATNEKMERLRKTHWMTDMTEKIETLGRLITEWSVSPDCHLKGTHSLHGVTRYKYMKAGPKTITKQQSYGIIPEVEDEQRIYVCTGGGPGFMEAAAKGASSVRGSRNIGMGITVPFEAGLNEHVSEDLAFQYHYFFTRKFWMVYHCQAIVAAPGGMGTLDELFEVLTLKQTGKVQGDLPVVLFGKKFWRTIVNWQSMADFGVISQVEVNQLFFTDCPHEAFDHIVAVLSGMSPILDGND